MTLPKGYSPSKSSGTSGGGNSAFAGFAGSSGATRDEIERMIGRRVENMRGIFVLGFILCWVGYSRWNLCWCYYLGMGLSITKWYLCSVSTNYY